MRTGDTIVACASAPGHGARAIVRLSGPHVPDALRAALIDAEDVAALRDGPPRAERVRLRIGAGLTLPTLLVRAAPGRSFTGEHGAEMLIPGNPWLVQRIVGDLLAVEGVRVAAPGEFSARAFLNGRLTAEQAEGIMLLIGATNEAQLDAAKRLIRGETGARYARRLNECAHVLAMVEAGIDFADQEDVVAITPAELAARLNTLVRKVDELLVGAPAVDAADAEALPRVVIVGAPNAGKSTLFNALLGRTRAVVSDRPGTTRDVLVEPLDLGPALPGGGAAHAHTRAALVDIAGLDNALGASGGVDERAQRAARAAIERADVLIHCDPAGAFALPIRAPAGAAVIRVRTKADLPRGGCALDDDASAIAVCALDGWNLDALRRAVADAATASRAGDALSVLPRHVAALRTARAALATAFELVRPHEQERDAPGQELIAAILREALDALGEIGGRVHPDDVIGRIFAAFCVGK